ncbi:hypothetical protein BV20DRAFT_969387 [Pilatotrama ljubarskyi]|nr:hypothetical protein BV20DRAFT_969387 [Pilatotrama ljubarskyi]
MRTGLVPYTYDQGTYILTLLPPGMVLNNTPVYLCVCLAVRTHRINAQRITV